MMLLTLGSGSKGNCYILKNESEALVIEAGVKFAEIERTLDFNITQICGVFVSHIHNDHSKYEKAYKKLGIPIFKPYDIADGRIHHVKYGNFELSAFPLKHDVPCYGVVQQLVHFGFEIYFRLWV